MADSDDITATHGTALRRALLRKVPPIEHEAKTVLADLAIDRASDLRSAIELEIDVFLTPLTTTLPRGSR